LLLSGELDADEDKADDSSDDGERVRAVDVPGVGDAPTAGDARETVAARALRRQHGERSAAVGRRGTRVPPADPARTTATARSTERQTGTFGPTKAGFPANATNEPIVVK